MSWSIRWSTYCLWATKHTSTKITFWQQNQSTGNGSTPWVSKASQIRMNGFDISVWGDDHWLFPLIPPPPMYSLDDPEHLPYLIGQHFCQPLLATLLGGEGTANHSWPSLLLISWGRITMTPSWLALTVKVGLPSPLSPSSNSTCFVFWCFCASEMSEAMCANDAWFVVIVIIAVVVFCCSLTWKKTWSIRRKANRDIIHSVTIFSRLLINEADNQRNMARAAGGEGGEGRDPCSWNPSQSLFRESYWSYHNIRGDSR